MANTKEEIMMHFNKTSMGLLLVGFALLISVLHIQSANAGGKIIINNDEWTLSVLPQNVAGYNNFNRLYQLNV